MFATKFFKLRLNSSIVLQNFRRIPLSPRITVGNFWNFKKERLNQTNFYLEVGTLEI